MFLVFYVFRLGVGFFGIMVLVILMFEKWLLCIRFVWIIVERFCGVCVLFWKLVIVIGYWLVLMFEIFMLSWVWVMLVFVVVSSSVCVVCWNIGIYIVCIMFIFFIIKFGI